MSRRLRFQGPGALALVSALWFSPSSARAQNAVQLPTVAVFSVQTSVIAPDSGRGFVDRLTLSARHRAYQNRRFMTRQPISQSSHPATMNVAQRLHYLSNTNGARRSASLSTLGLPNIAGRTNGHSTYFRGSPYSQRARQRSYILAGSR